MRKAVLRVLAWGMAGLAYSVYGYADWIARMGVPFTAEDEFLHAWAALIGIYPKEATGSAGYARFTGTPDRILPNATALRRQDGTTYTVTEQGTVDEAGVVVVPIRATVKGAFTNAADGALINITTQVLGVNAPGITVGALVGGADQETNPALRNRMLARYRAPAQGGAGTDYIGWALEVPGCTRAWVVGWGGGPGSVVVYPMFDDAEAEYGGFPQGDDGTATDEVRGTPATGDQLLVADHIWPLQPVTSIVYVVAALPFPVDVTLVALTPNTEDVRPEIIETLKDMFLAVGEIAGVIFPSQLYEAILATPGIGAFTMTEPKEAVQAPSGHLPILGELVLVGEGGEIV